MIYHFTSVEKILLNKGVIPQPLFDTSTNIALSRVLTAAVKTGITDALTGAYQSLAELAQKTNLNEQALALSLDCLEAFGYVRKRNGKFAFSKNGKKFLSRESPDNFLQYILFSAGAEARSFRNLEDILPTGCDPRNNLASFTEEEWRLFTLAMVDIARTNVAAITKRIPTPAGSRKLLDLGGSHGLYSIWQCKEHPALKADILDAEAVRGYADAFIREHDMQDRISFIAGDFMDMEWDKDYDMIFAFNIIHGMTEEANRRLFAKAAQSLSPKGIFVIFDQIKDMKGKSQLSRAISSFMGMNLYLHTGGRTYGRTELTDMLKQSGFISVKIKKLPVPGCGLVIAN